MKELIKASAYYGRRTPGWVALIDGQPWHFTGLTAKRDAQAAVAGTKPAAFDELGFIMAWEDGEIESDEELAAGFQHLIDNGHAWQLQGMYGRTAHALIEAGLCHA